MSLLDEKDLDELWDEYAGLYDVFDWCKSHLVTDRVIKQDLIMKSKAIAYDSNERNWLQANGLWEGPIEMFYFYVANVSDFKSFKKLVGKIKIGEMNNIYLIIPKHIDITNVPQLLRNVFKVTYDKDIRGKADGFYTGRN